MSYLLYDESNKYILNKLLGAGLTCKCFLGQKIISPSKYSELFAIKIFPQKFHEYYLNEVNILSKLSSNNNIIKLYEHGQGYIEPLSDNDKLENTNEINDKENQTNSESNTKIDKEKIFFSVMEYIPNGELKDYVQGTSTRIPEKISAKIFANIALTVKCLHENNIAHCDIKPENILMNNKYRPILNDFGFSHFFETKNGDYTLHKFAGSVIYSGPETRKAYTKGFDALKNDIFSLGILLFVITIGDFPFQKASYSDYKYRYIIKRNYTKFWEHFNYIEISDEFKDLINKLICITPSQRLDIDKVLDHPWLKKYINICNKDDNKIEIGDNFVDDDVFNEFNSRKG